MEPLIKKFLIFFILIVTSAFFINGITQPAQAVCPVCTVAVGAGLGLSRYLGIDDTISGLWLGGLIISTSFWTTDWLKKRGFQIQGKILSFLITVLFSVLTLLPLWYSGIIGHPFNTVTLNLNPWNNNPDPSILVKIDKLIFGALAGIAVFLLALGLDKYVRHIRGQQLFLYQKVVFPVMALILTSLLFNLFF